MKKIYLIRHAKSSWKFPELVDFDRPLNSRGLRDAPVMGQRLKAQNIYPDLILSSSANRAKATIQIISKEIGYLEDDIVYLDKLYEASVNELYSILQEIDDSVSEVFVVGHNFEFTIFAEEITLEYIDNIPTCGIYAVEFDMDLWKHIRKTKGKKMFFDYPKKVV